MTGSDTASLGAKLLQWYSEVWESGTAEAVDPIAKSVHPQIVAALCRLLHLDPGLAQRGLDPTTMLRDSLALMHGRLPQEADEVAPRVKAVLRAAYNTPSRAVPAPPAAPPTPPARQPPMPQSSPQANPAVKRPVEPTAFRSPEKRQRAEVGGTCDAAVQRDLKTRLAASVTDEGWREVLAPEFDQLYFARICGAVEQGRAEGRKVLPAENEVFAAFNATPWDKVRVVLLGQDPYPGAGQAHGLAFSVRRGVPVPASLRNVYDELKRDIPGFDPPPHGNLEAWARQGVLLLNATLTVAAGKPNSHSEIGWQTLTDKAIKAISDRKQGVVFLLWGNFARKKKALIDLQRHKVIEAAHPSPNSVALWQGCRVFSKTNAALEALGQPPIDWQN